MNSNRKKDGTGDYFGLYQFFMMKSSTPLSSQKVSITAYTTLGRESGTTPGRKKFYQFRLT